MEDNLLTPAQRLRAWRQAAAPGTMPLMQRASIGRLTESTDPTLYGCCGIFDLCGDADLMSLSFEGQNPLLDWIGWQATLDCIIRRMFITWVSPEKSNGVCSPGYMPDPCASPYGVDWGKCEFELHDFGRLGRQGPVRDITMNAVRLCAAQPRYRLDGTLITNDFEWDLRLITEAILQDLKRYIIIGNASVAGQFDGLRQLIKYPYVDPVGHECTSMNSNVIDWNDNPMTGGAGQTWNGQAIGPADIINVLLAVYRRIRQRIMWAPALASQQMRVGDMVLVMPSALIPCLLDYYACWSVCPGADNVNTKEARDYRQQLNGGMFGAGRIFLDGFEIPILPHDWELLDSRNVGDMMLLTGSVGNVKLINGQYLDMRPVPGAYPGLAGQAYAVTDGGRLLTWTEVDEMCVETTAAMRPRLLMWAPWAQARIDDVACTGILPPISPDPCDASFSSELCFAAPLCNEIPHGSLQLV